jgi:hypothetical protein
MKVAMLLDQESCTATAAGRVMGCFVVYYPHRSGITLTQYRVRKRHLVEGEIITSRSTMHFTVSKHNAVSKNPLAMVIECYLPND